MTIAPGTPPPITLPPSAEAPGAWQAVHVYYGAIRQAMLTDCVRPLVAGLRKDGLIAGWFFINYWVEGPHLRLRLKPRTAAQTGEVLRRAEAAIEDFLKVRPALYDARSATYTDLYSTLFDVEFTPEQRARYTGPDGTMNFRENNTFSREEYEPEYGKYGGRAGVALAEWHFEHSSDLVVEVLRTMNVHLRPVVLGVAAQLMMVMSSVFLDDAGLTADFLERYHDFWNWAFDSSAFVKESGYDDAYEAMGAGVRERFAVVRGAVARGEADRLPGVLSGWAAHCAQLRARVGALAAAGELVFSGWGEEKVERITDPQLAALRLLSPYLHMTNNRLGTTLADEAYLSHILSRALREVAP
jgi:hypothetical protein